VSSARSCGSSACRSSHRCGLGPPGGPSSATLHLARTNAKAAKSRTSRASSSGWSWNLLAEDVRIRSC